MSRVALGETGYLRPHTLGCPAICWRQPRVRVVAVSSPYVKVVLADGPDRTRYEVHEDNLIKARAPRPAPRAPRPAPRVVLAPGEEEVTLW